LKLPITLGITKTYTKEGSHEFSLESSERMDAWGYLQSKILRKDSQAFEALEQALKLAELEGYIRIFLDEGMSLIRLLQRYLLDQRTTIAVV
jgi:hypothetical protein